MLGFYVDRGSVYAKFRQQKNGQKISLVYYPGFSDELWNNEMKRFKDQKLQTEKVKIEKAIHDVLEKYDPFSLDNKTFEQYIKEALQGKKMIKLDFYEYCEEYFKHAIHKTTRRRAQCFRTCINKIKEFEPNLTFDQINRKFYNDFVEHLRKQNFSTNYIGSVIRDLVRILNWASDNGDYKDLTYKSFKKPHEDVYNIYLSEDEIQRIYDLNITPELLSEAYEKRKQLALTKGEEFREKFPAKQNLERIVVSLDRARKLFVIGCWTGLRVENYLDIDPDIQIDLKEGILHAVANKNGPKLQIPLHRLVRQIVEKDGFPKSISEQNLNYHIKELGELAGIDQMILFTKTQGYSRVEYAVPKYKLIKTHTARRSFASNLVIRGVPKQYIMAVTGHTTERSFNKYTAAVNKDMLTAKLKDFDLWK